jgi:hypothetical protein
VDDAELKRWEEHEAIDDLTKQRNEDRAKGLMPAPGPRRPWVKPSFPAPSNESKQLMSPSMRRQCDVWGKAYSAQQAKQRLETQAAKRKRDDEEGGLRKRSRTRRSRSRSPRDDPSPGNPPPPPPDNPPSGSSSASESSARDSSTRDLPTNYSRSSGSSTRDPPARDSPAGQSLASRSPSNMRPPTPASHQNARGDGSSAQTTPQPPRWRTGADAFSKVPMPSSKGKRTSSDTSPSPPSPKKRKTEASESEQQAGEEEGGSDNDSQSSESWDDRRFEPSPSEESSEEEHEEEQAVQSPSPELETIERGSAPPELPPARDDSILDAASVLLDSFEQRETRSAPP